MLKKKDYRLWEIQAAPGSKLFASLRKPANLLCMTPDNQPKYHAGEPWVWCCFGGWTAEGVTVRQFDGVQEPTQLRIAIDTYAQGLKTQVDMEPVRYKVAAVDPKIRVVAPQQLLTLGDHAFHLYYKFGFITDVRTGGNETEFIFEDTDDQQHPFTIPKGAIALSEGHAFCLIRFAHLSAPQWGENIYTEAVVNLDGGEDFWLNRLSERFPGGLLGRKTREIRKLTEDAIERVYAFAEEGEPQLFDLFGQNIRL